MSSFVPSSFSKSFTSALSLIGMKFTDRELGRGSDAVVVEVDHQGTLCAAKKLHQILLDDQSSGGAQRLVMNFENEITTWYSLRHPHIVLLLGVHFEQGSHIPTLILEKMQSSLRKYVETYKKEEIPLSDKVFILRQVSQALAYIHSRQPPLVHHDLSPNNILLNQDSLLTKITDFGMSRVVDPSQSTRKSSVKGTQAFMPPEALVSPPKYTEKLDIFSFGTITLFTVTHLWPEPGPPIVFEGDKVVAVLELQRREQYIKSMTAKEHSSSFAMIRSCLENRPDRRPTSLHLVEHMRQMEKDHPRLDRSNESNFTAQLTQQLEEKDKQLKEKDDLLKSSNDQLRHTQEQMRIQGRDSSHYQPLSTLKQSQKTPEHLHFSDKLSVSDVITQQPPDEPTEYTNVKVVRKQLSELKLELQQSRTQFQSKDQEVYQIQKKLAQISQDFYFTIRKRELTSLNPVLKAELVRIMANLPLRTDEPKQLLLDHQDVSSTTAPPDYNEACRDDHRFQPAASQFPQDSQRVGSNEDNLVADEAQKEQQVLSEMCWFPFGFKTATIDHEGGVLAVDKETDLNAGPPGLMYTYVEVPPNSVKDGQHITIHCGITPVGPFVLPGGYTPCSMVVYLVVRGDTLLKPIYLNNPSWATDEVENGKIRSFLAPHTPRESKFKFEFFDENSYKASPQSCRIGIDGTSCMFVNAIEDDDRPRGDDDRSRGRSFQYRCHVFKEEVEEVYTKKLLLAFTYNSEAWAGILSRHYCPPSYKYFTSSSCAFRLGNGMNSFSLKMAKRGKNWRIHVDGEKKIPVSTIDYWKLCENNADALKNSVRDLIYPPKLLCVVTQDIPPRMPIDVEVLGPDDGSDVAYQVMVFEWSPPENLNQTEENQSELSPVASQHVGDAPQRLPQASNQRISSESGFFRESRPRSQQSESHLPIAPPRKDAVQEVLELYKVDFLKEVVAESISYKLRDSRLITEALATKLNDEPDREKSASTLWNHLHTSCTVEQAPDLFKIMFESKGNGKMNRLGKNMDENFRFKREHEVSAARLKYRSRSSQGTKV